MQKSRLFLIDAHALCYRAFYAIKGLSTSYGQATNAVYGFINTLKKIDKEFHPEYWAVCFDTPARTHREEKYARYKIQRPVMPDDLISQIPIIQDVISAYRMCRLACDGYEADDIIATVVKNLQDQDLDIVIVSEDKDVYQLTGPHVSIYHGRKGKMLGYSQVETELGIRPDYIPDLIGLAGDPTDNIPGIKGIGLVSAKRLINDHGRIEEIFKDLNRIKSPGLREKLSQQQEIALLSKQLAQLETDVPVDIDVKAMQTTEPDYQKLFTLFSGLEFKRWAEEAAAHCQSDIQVDLRRQYSQEDMQELIADMTRERSCVFIRETVHTETPDTPADGLFVSALGNQIFVIPPHQIDCLSSVWGETDIVKVGHDIKNELKGFISADLPLTGPFFDVMLAAYLLNPSRGIYDVTHLAGEYLKMPFSQDQSPEKHLVLVRRLYDLLKSELNDKALLELFQDIEMPLTVVLARLETTGVRIDQDFLRQLSEECEAEIQTLHHQVYGLAGQEFNLNSPKQLSEILFGKLKLPVIKKTKTGYSTDEGVLRTLAQKHQLPAIILQYRHLAKLKSTYIDALPKLLDPSSGRIHADFNQTGTETGRLSSSNPNLQNIPIRTELGRKIRRAFVPSEKDYRIVSADYSQIELRVLAHLSQDEALIRAFQKSEDIHQYTASLVFDVPAAEVTSEMRYQAKRVNFGIIYGMSPYGLAKDLGIPLNAAEDFIRKYFERYPKVKEFMDACVRHCEENGYVLTLLNRRRYIPEINSINQGIRQFAQRQAINTPVQGSAADLIKLAMIKIDQALARQKLRSRMIITVHDELVFEAPPDELESLTDLIRKNMENSMQLSVPLCVVIKQGLNWLDLHELP